MYVRTSGKPLFDADGEFRGLSRRGTSLNSTHARAGGARAVTPARGPDLAHMNRLSMMGELAASLAHEIVQPIAAARNNSRASIHFLDRSPPDLGQIREALTCVVNDADRAGDIIDRIRDQIKKTPPQKERFDLNKAVHEVVALAGSAITTNGVSVRTTPRGGATSRPRWPTEYARPTYSASWFEWRSSL